MVGELRWGDDRQPSSRRDPLEILEVKVVELERIIESFGRRISELEKSPEQRHEEAAEALHKSGVTAEDISLRAWRAVMGDGTSFTASDK